MNAVMNMMSPMYARVDNEPDVNSVGWSGSISGADRKERDLHYIAAFVSRCSLTLASTCRPTAVETSLTLGKTNGSFVSMCVCESICQSMSSFVEFCTIFRFRFLQFFLLRRLSRNSFFFLF
jgi:hypothetical protein